jgi:hypothetical protein
MESLKFRVPRAGRAHACLARRLANCGHLRTQQAGTDLITLRGELPELSPMVADMVRIQRLTGCRPAELLAMTRQASHAGDPERWRYSPRRHKTKHHTFTPLGSSRRVTYSKE